MYEMEYRPQHPRADVMGFVPLYILVAEKALGRPLEKGEVVHHRDFRKYHDELSNLLFPITRKEHQQLPAFQARFLIERGFYEKFLEWWRQAKGVVDELAELEKSLVRAKNQRKKILVKLEKQSG